MIDVLTAKQTQESSDGFAAKEMQEEILIDELKAKQTQESTDEFAAQEMQASIVDVDALVNQFNKVELDEEPLTVDRHRPGNNPNHKVNPLSDIPGGQYSVFTKGVMYPNIHNPRAYVNAILVNNPQQKLKVFFVDNEGNKTLQFSENY